MLLLSLDPRNFQISFLIYFLSLYSFKTCISLQVFESNLGLVLLMTSIWRDTTQQIIVTSFEFVKACIVAYCVTSFWELFYSEECVLPVCWVEYSLSVESI